MKMEELYFFAAISCSKSDDGGHHWKFALISNTFITNKYPTK